VAERRRPHASPSRADGEGMRVIAKTPTAGGGRWLWATGAAVIAAALLTGWWLWPAPVRGEAVVAAQAAAGDAGAPQGRAPSPQVSQAAAQRESSNLPSNDPNDLAAYFQPGDPEPTGKQVIEALQQAGVRTGLGAFNPPGTSPPLLGLAVPEGFELPPGYVRHHQVTDEGVPIEPVLMFAPGFTLRDARGRPIAMPDDRIVPPELAPPGMPRRPIRIPPPR
jgi:hypothetical protein